MAKWLDLLRTAFSRRHRPSTRPRGPHRRLQFEVLEDRSLPSAPVPLAPVSPPSTLAGDFNGDGRSDVARLTPTGIWQVGLSHTSYFDLNFWARWGSRSNWRSLLVGDFNGDHKADVAGLDRRGSLFVGLSDGTSFNTAVWGRWPGTTYVRVVAGDFNADGKTDLAGIAANGTWVVGLSTGNGFQSSVWGNWGAARAFTTIDVGDFDGDHHTDVLALRRDGTWVVGLTRGAAFERESWGNWGASSQWLDVEVGDFNGDQHTDVAVLGRNGVVGVGLAGAGQFSLTNWDRWARTRWADLEVADLNHDGRDDLAALTPTGVLYVALADTSGFRTGLWATGWRGGALLLAGDWNGDQLADLAVLLPSGAWLAGLSLRTGLASRVFAQWPLGLDQYRYTGDVAPYAAGQPWSINANRAYVEAQAPVLLQNMTFNGPTSYALYVDNFYGVLRSWIKEADLAGINSDDRLGQFLAQRLDAHFAQTRSVIARFYPRRTEQTYRLLMTMNLAHGFLAYGTVATHTQNLYRTLHLVKGDCSEIADVLAALLRVQGVNARILGLVFNYPTPQGRFIANHQVVYADGLWLDAETNIGMAVNLAQVQRWSPAARLEALLDRHHVYGYYNWYLNPNVRQRQLAAGYDGGIIAYYYQYYLQGIGNSNSLVYFVRGR